MPENVLFTKCGDCKWCQKIPPKEVKGILVDATCDSHWGASSFIQSKQTTYENIAKLGAREDILGYEPAGHPEWAKLLKHDNRTCFQDTQDRRPELLQDAS